MAQRSSVSSRRVTPHQTNAADTTEPVWVRTSFDILNPPPLTTEQEEELRKLDNLRDEDIDFSDIPSLADRPLTGAVRNPYYAKALKESLTIRLDADILDWFKRHAKDGKGYQTDINKALRAFVVAQEKRATKKTG